MNNRRIYLCINAEVHFPASDKVVLEGITGNISQSGIKINNLQHNPSLTSEATDVVLVKLFFEDGNQVIPVTLQSSLARGHRRGLGIKFLSISNKQRKKLDCLIRKTLKDGVIKYNRKHLGWHLSKAA
jgi:hypothetical protein